VIGEWRRPRDVKTDDPTEVARRVSMLDRPVLIACDVDGTLSDIAPTPTEARLTTGAVAALNALVARRVHVVVVSGRSIRDLRDQFGLGAGAGAGAGDGDGLLLVGSHGAEMAGTDIDGAEIERATIAEAAPLDAVEEATLRVVGDELERFAAAVPGALVEVKPCAVALHVRLVDPLEGVRLLDAVRDHYSGAGGVTLLEGKQVIEVAIRSVTKGRAIERIRKQLSAASVVFIGDDVSDETAFGVLGRDDLAVRVGPGDTLADCRLAEPSDVVRMLTELAATWS
jgi:trehalose-phosphatase